MTLASAYHCKPAGTVELSVVLFAWGALAPLLPTLPTPFENQSFASENSFLMSHPLWLVIAGLSSGALSALTMHFAVRRVMPGFLHLTNFQSVNRVVVHLFRLFVWTMPALGVGILVALLMGLLGIYQPQPYAMLGIEALGYFCGGLAGIKSLAATQREDVIAEIG